MQHYYRAQGHYGGFRFIIYTWDESGNKMIIKHQSEAIYYTKAEAEDAASDWAEDNKIDVELG